VSDTNAGGAARSRSELAASAPRLRDLAAQLQNALIEAQREGWRDTSAGEPHEATEVAALWQATIAVDRIAEAVLATRREDKVERLADAADRAGAVLGAVQQRLAELQTHDELATAEEGQRDVALDTEAIVTTARLDLELPGATTATVILTVDLSGRVAWHSDTVDLADVNGVDQLAVTTALRMLGQTLTLALPDESSP
jgi:hypothetical protein